jgi:hypothetical protein
VEVLAMQKRKHDDPNVIWGAEAIGREIDRSAEQTRALYRSGAFGDAVRKLGHRTLAGDRAKLKQFPNLKAESA